MSIINSKNETFIWIKKIILIVLSSLLQSYAILVFVRGSSMLSSGFTGLSILIHEISNLIGINLDISLLVILLNLPFAIICFKRISFRFTMLSTLQFVLTSLFLSILKFEPVFSDHILDCTIGGTVYGFSLVLALVSGGSSGGTDFIALLISDKIGKSIWQHIFVFNAIMLLIFGYLFGFEYAGYSILFQFISTKTIEKFHHRYDQVTLQITTSKAEEVIQAYMSNFRHGMSVVPGYGGYSHMDLSVCHTIVSSYEVEEIINVLKKADPNIIINVFQTQSFHGRFYRKAID